jgi:hypothetical protein
MVYLTPRIPFLAGMVRYAESIRPEHPETHAILRNKRTDEIVDVCEIGYIVTAHKTAISYILDSFKMKFFPNYRGEESLTSILEHENRGEGYDASVVDKIYKVERLTREQLEEKVKSYSDLSAIMGSGKARSIF